jgi:hypothetical protein
MVYKIKIIGENAYVRRALKNGDLREELVFKTRKEAETYLYNDPVDVDISCFDLEIVEVEE